MTTKKKDVAYYIQQRDAVAKSARARRIGKLIATPCEVCGNPKVIGHHRWGYAPENVLRVVWLCLKCHAAEHKRMNEEAAS